MYKILIADDHPLFREAIHNVISDGFPGSEIMETADLDSALAMTLENDDLDLILLDLNMPGMHGLNGLINLRNEAPTIPVVIVSAEQDKQIVLQAITYGAVGFIQVFAARADDRCHPADPQRQCLPAAGHHPLAKNHLPAQPLGSPQLPSGTAAGADPQATAGAGAHDQGRVEQTDRLQPGYRRNHGQSTRLRHSAQTQCAQPGAGDPVRRRYRLRRLFASLSPIPDAS